jgi:hypothetical protein
MLTGIEIGPDYCTLVGVRRHRGAVELRGVRVLGSGEWPSDHQARVERLRAVRSTSGFPRDCVVVIWDEAAAIEPSPLEALSEAGFRARHLSTPTDALAALARTTPRPTGSQGTAWLALNTNAGAIAVVLNGVLLYSKSFEWAIAAPDERRNAHLLRRYLRVAQTVTELRRAMQAVEDSQHVRVDTVVTCGNFPDLRSMTMPLIERTDLEVETLDSTTGLEFGDRLEELLQVAASIRLAAAAAVTQTDEGRPPGIGRAAGVAVAVTLAAVAVWWSYSQRSQAPAVTAPGASPSPGVVSMRSGPGEVPEIASSRGSTPAVDEPGVPVPPADSSAAPAPRPSEGEPAATSGRVGGPEAGVRRRAGEPLPVVEGVLIAPARRLAVVGGDVVEEGDVVGSRRVLRIEADAVVLRDATGRDVRVPVRARTPGM